MVIVNAAAVVVALDDPFGDLSIGRTSSVVIITSAAAAARHTCVAWQL